MANETSDFDAWVERVEKETSGHDLKTALDTLSQRARGGLSLQIWFVEILGRRWSYVAGEKIEKPPEADVHRIFLKNNIGAVSDTWEKLSDKKRRKLIDVLNKIIERSTESRNYAISK